MRFLTGSRCPLWLNACKFLVTPYINIWGSSQGRRLPEPGRGFRGCFGVSLLPLPRYSLLFVFWSRLRRVTFQRWKVTKDRRACGPGPRVGAKSAPFRFRLKPKTALRSFAPPSPHRTRFAGLRRGPHEGAAVEIRWPASPLVVTRRFSLRPQYFGHWPLGRISPLQNL